MVHAKSIRAALKGANKLLTPGAKLAPEAQHAIDQAVRAQSRKNANNRRSKYSQAKKARGSA